MKTTIVYWDNRAYTGNNGTEHGNYQNRVYVYIYIYIYIHIHIALTEGRANLYAVPLA